MGRSDEAEVGGYALAATKSVEKRKTIAEDQE
jgi:hypothetical protein